VIHYACKDSVIKTLYQLRLLIGAILWLERNTPTFRLAEIRDVK